MKRTVPRLVAHSGPCLQYSTLVVDLNDSRANVAFGDKDTSVAKMSGDEAPVTKQTGLW